MLSPHPTSPATFLASRFCHSPCCAAHRLAAMPFASFVSRQALSLVGFTIHRFYRPSRHSTPPGHLSPFTNSHIHPSPSRAIMHPYARRAGHSPAPRAIMPPCARHAGHSPAPRAIMPPHARHAGHSPSSRAITAPHARHAGHSPSPRARMPPYARHA